MVVRIQVGSYMEHDVGKMQWIVYSCAKIHPLHDTRTHLNLYYRSISDVLTANP